MALPDTLTIDFSTFPTSDGEPMAETLANMVQMFDLIFTLRRLLSARGLTRWAVGGNQFLYFDPADGRKHLSPDVYVALDVAPGGRNTWETWVEGKVQDIVFEITSPSTQAEDLDRTPGGKFWRYEQLGVQEYYLYDPQDVLRPRFQGYARQGGRLEPLPVLPSGGIVSPLLDTELRPLPIAESFTRPPGVYLRLLDRVGGVPLVVPDELEAAQERAEERAAEQERARQAAEDRAEQAEAALRAALEALAQRSAPNDA